MADEVIQASRGKALAMVAICALLALITADMVLAGGGLNDRGLGGAGLVLSIVGIGFFTWRAARPRRLVVRPEGLLFDKGIGGPVLTPWRDIETVFVWRVDTASLLAYRLKSATVPANVAEAARSIRSLGGGWPGAVEDVAARLETYRAANS